MTQACVSLEEAHAAGIIHRDIKPENLMLCQTVDGHRLLKLLDFGIARLRAPEQGEPQLTGTGFLAGTPPYMAPELWRGAPADERSDIYALGVTLYFVLSGGTPPHAWFTGETPIEGPASEPPGIPDALKAVIRRCLAKNPEDRFQSAHQLRLALEETRLSPAVAATGL